MGKPAVGTVILAGVLASSCRVPEKETYEPVQVPNSIQPEPTKVDFTTESNAIFMDVNNIHSVRKFVVANIHKSPDEISRNKQALLDAMGLDEAIAYKMISEEFIKGEFSVEFLSQDPDEAESEMVRATRERFWSMVENTDPNTPFEQATENVAKQIQEDLAKNFSQQVRSIIEMHEILEIAKGIKGLPVRDAQKYARQKFAGPGVTEKDVELHRKAMWAVFPQLDQHPKPELANGKAQGVERGR